MSPEEARAVARLSKTMEAWVPELAAARLRLELETRDMMAQFERLLSVIGDDPELLEIIAEPMGRVFDGLRRVGVDPGQVARMAD